MPVDPIRSPSHRTRRTLPPEAGEAPDPYAWGGDRTDAPSPPDVPPAAARSADEADEAGEADPADRAEQARVVELDEDDYR